MAISSVGNFGTPQPAAPQQGGAPAQQAARPEVQLQAPPSQPPPDRAKVEQVVKALRQLVETVVSNNLNFSIDDSTGKTVVRVTDGETGEMIRQIPSEEMLDIAASLDKMQGLLLRQEA
ncbi:MAG: flagellar protein FlaG [Rhodocyclaceae bacterium]|nr:flagellar protein FlaG [Rhodocyclaceae bacterium]